MQKKNFYLLLLFTVLTTCGFTQLTRSLPKMHYFYNSGWLVETATHLLVFDFIPHTESGITTATLEKKLSPAIASGKNIIILISHDHNDHFDSSLFKLAGAENIRYVLGWKYAGITSQKNTHIVTPGDSLSLPGCKVYAHAATDDGSGFLVKLNDITLYHAGDHALWVHELLEPFKKELEYIRSKAAVIDLAFLPAARGLFTKCAYDTVIEKGIAISIDILQPRTVALQHIGCIEKLPLYTTIKQHFGNKKVNWVIPTRYNQSF